MDICIGRVYKQQQVGESCQCRTRVLYTSNVYAYRWLYTIFSSFLEVSGNSVVLFLLRTTGDLSNTKED